MKTYEFTGEIKKHSFQDAAYIEFPYNVEEEFGVKGQVKVKATFDGYEYRGSLAKMGHYCHMIGITKKIREEINKQPGDMVQVVIIKDEAPRIVEIPEYFQAKLMENPEAKKFFEGLSYSNQKKYTDWLTSAKKAETRENRVNNSMVMLLEGKKQPK